MKTLSNRLFGKNFDNTPDKSAADDMRTMLRNLDVPFERIGWDAYDFSLEVHGVPPEYRLTAEARKALAAEDFSTVYVNHTDKWETHYNLSDVSRDGWRVSYPHKRDPARNGEGGIWVEKVVPQWPQKWFDTGYAIVVTKQEGLNAGLPEA